MKKSYQSKQDDDNVVECTLKIIEKGSIISTFDELRQSLDPPVRYSFEPPMDKNHRGFSKNIRTDGLSVLQVVEMVSMALTNARGASYGSRRSSVNATPRGSPPTKMPRGNNADSFRYQLHHVQFHPCPCTWDAWVEFSAPASSAAAAVTVLEKKNSVLPEESQQTTCSDVLQGKFPLHVTCTVVGTLENDGQYADTRRTDEIMAYHEHVSIDVHVALTEELRRSTNKCMLSAMSETLDRISSDIAKEFILEKLPCFPEGNRGTAFTAIYQLNVKLKSGSFSTVYAGKHRMTGKRCAVKCINRKKISPQDDVGILSEVFLLSCLDHPRICTVHDFFIEDDYYFIIMPLMEGGDVFDSIGRRKSYDESIARNVVRDLLQALSYLHGNNIVHCDLKSKNLLLEKIDEPSSVVLGDFGFATRVYFPKSLMKQCGTPYFVAPEVLLGTGYDTKADMWSLGVIVYSLLSGDLPFTGKTHLELFKKIIKCNFDFDADVWRDVSHDAKDLIQHLLWMDPNSRLSATDALQHPWIRADGRILRQNSLMNTSARLKTFNARLKLKSAILAIHSVIIWRNVTFAK